MVKSKNSNKTVAQMPLHKLLQRCLVILERVNVYTCEICETVYCDKESLMRHLVTHMKCKDTLENNTEKNPDSTSTHVTTQQPDISIRDRIRFESDSYDAHGDTKCSEDKRTCDYEPLRIEQDASSSSSEVLNMSFLRKISQGCKENKSKPSSVTKLTKQKQATVRSGTDNCDQQVNFQTGKQYTCDKCKKSFSKKQGLRAHEKLHSLEKTLMCEFCERLFMFKRQLKVHRRKHTGERPYSCKVCDKSFRNCSSLSLHKRSYHSDLYDPLEATALPICAICNERFCQKSNVLRHIYQCHITMGYPCSICPKEFGHPVVRDKHMLIHKHKARFKCCECGKCFRYRFFSTQCELSHKKPYECPNCTTKFGRKYHLERHMKDSCKRLNQKEKPFKCTNCRKQYARKYKLTAHIKYSCKPHECAKCKARFAEASTLKIHKNDKVCKRKMYECDLCHKKVATKRVLVRHINIYCKGKASSQKT